MYADVSVCIMDVYRAEEGHEGIDIASVRDIGPCVLDGSEKKRSLWMRKCVSHGKQCAYKNGRD